LPFDLDAAGNAADPVPFGAGADIDQDGARRQRQQFVRLGERRGDMVAVVDGLNVGQVVVTTGAFKLRNGGQVVVDNKLAPSAVTSPRPKDS
jgi:membrane fusion protein (multidrug efflux system)